MTSDQSGDFSCLDVKLKKVNPNKLLWRACIARTMSDTEVGDVGRASPTHGTRAEKSLGLLTARFVELLQKAEGGVLDLKKVLSYTMQWFAHSLLLCVS